MGEGYEEGDFVVMIKGCEASGGNQNCERELDLYQAKSKERLAAS